jgi:hypothetical protein
MAGVDTKIWIPVIVLVVSAFFLGIYQYRNIVVGNIFREKDLIQRGMELPTIWLYYDTSDVNSRWWADFGARSSRALNLPFLNLCYQTIVLKNTGIYRVEIISGLSDLANRLGGIEHLPKKLQNRLAIVNEPELNWIRATVLAKFGGLWIHPASISLRSFPALPEDGSAVFYGTDADESYAGSGGTAVPSMYAMGCKQPGNPVFTEWSVAAFNRLENGNLGGAVRRDAKWDFVSFASGKPGVQMIPHGELSRKKNGKRIQIEDLLAAGQDGKMDFVVHSESIYVPIPWPEMRDRRMFGWFLRMSEDQILESDLAITYLFEMGLNTQ